jgi:hypothetical protein
MKSSRASDWASHRWSSRRGSKVTGAHWVQTLTFGFIETPEATLNQLAQVSADLGVSVTPQGLEDRRTDEAVQFLPAM